MKLLLIWERLPAAGRTSGIHTQQHCLLFDQKEKTLMLCRKSK